MTDTGRRWVAPLAGPRARAYGRDALGYLGVAVALVPVGATIVLLKVPVSRPAATALSAIPPVVATVWAALAESGPHRATWGKRREHLVVVPDMARATPGDAKAAAPSSWELRGDHGAPDGSREAHDGIRPGRESRVPLARALVRNTVKIALPWQLGHMVALGGAYGDFDRNDPVALAAAITSYALSAALIGFVVVRPGRGLQDRLARMTVQREIPGAGSR